MDALLRVNAKCISGRQEAAKHLIFDATRPLKAPNPRGSTSPTTGRRPVPCQNSCGVPELGHYP
jgi:hypothetical protein